MTRLDAIRQRAKASRHRERSHPAERDRAYLLALVEEAHEALRALYARLDEITRHPSYQSVFTLAQVHGAPYQGPQWGTEVEQARAALAAFDADAEERTDA